LRVRKSEHSWVNSHERRDPGTIEAATAAEPVNGEARHQLCLGLKPSWEFQQLTIVDRSSFAMNAVVPRDASKTAQRLDIIADGEPLA
jgi:hypothetical protein